MSTSRLGLPENAVSGRQRRLLPGVQPALTPTEAAAIATPGLNDFAEAASNAINATYAIVQKEIEETNRTMVIEASNKLNSEIVDLFENPDYGLNQQRGGNVLNVNNTGKPASAYFSSEFDTRAAKIREGLKNEDQRRQFDLNLQSQRNDFISKTRRYENAESFKWKQETRINDLTNHVNRSVTSFYDATPEERPVILQSAKQGIIDRIEDLGNIQGISEEEKKARVQTGVSQYASMVFMESVNRGDSNAAYQVIQTYRDDLTGDTRAKLESTLATLREQDAIQAAMLNSYQSYNVVTGEYEGGMHPIFKVPGVEKFNSQVTTEQMADYFYNTDNPKFSKNFKDYMVQMSGIQIDPSRMGDVNYMQEVTKAYIGRLEEKYESDKLAVVFAAGNQEAITDQAIKWGNDTRNNWWLFFDQKDDSGKFIYPEQRKRLNKIKQAFGIDFSEVDIQNQVDANPNFVQINKSNNNFSKMVQKAVRTGRFLERRGNRNHEGIDLALPMGTPIYSPGAGVVSRVGFQANGAGHYAVITYPNGYEAKFFHMREAPNLQQGQRVDANTVIGNVGSTGRSTGPHLHLEVRQKKGSDGMVLIDPNIFFGAKLPQTWGPGMNAQSVASSVGAGSGDPVVEGPNRRPPQFGGSAMPSASEGGLVRRAPTTYGEMVLAATNMYPNNPRLQRLTVEAMQKGEAIKESEFEKQRAVTMENLSVQIEQGTAYEELPAAQLATLSPGQREQLKNEHSRKVGVLGDSPEAIAQLASGDFLTMSDEEFQSTYKSSLTPETYAKYQNTRAEIRSNRGQAADLPSASEMKSMFETVAAQSGISNIADFVKTEDYANVQTAAYLAISRQQALAGRKLSPTEQQEIVANIMTAIPTKRKSNGSVQLSPIDYTQMPSSPAAMRGELFGVTGMPISPEAASISMAVTKPLIDPIQKTSNNQGWTSIIPLTDARQAMKQENERNRVADNINNKARERAFTRQQSEAQISIMLSNTFGIPSVNPTTVQAAYFLTGGNPNLLKNFTIADIRRKELEIQRSNTAMPGR